MIRDPRIIKICTVMTPRNSHKNNENRLYTQWTATRFGEQCPLLQGNKIQRLHTLKLLKAKVMCKFRYFVIPFRNFNVSNLCISIPQEGYMFGRNMW